MSANPKPRGTASGQPETAMSQLKAVWHRLPEPAQDYWREQFLSSRKQSELRAEIFTKLKVKLSGDSKLTNFRAWLDQQAALDQVGSEMEDDYQRFKKLFPTETEDEIRQKCFLAYNARAMARGDTGLGKFMLRQSLHERKFLFSQQQALEAKKDEQTKALEFCLDEAKKFPAVMKLFEAAFAALAKAKAQ